MVEPGFPVFHPCPGSLGRYHQDKLRPVPERLHHRVDGITRTVTHNGHPAQSAHQPAQRRPEQGVLGHPGHLDFIGTSFETIDPGLGIDTYRHYIRANGKTIMIREDVAGTVSHRYVHRDHLGSVTALTDEATGNVIERYSYDAWGMRRSASDWQSSVTSTIENRGYTGHEHLDDVGVIHMNGRVYSPSLGRMLSPDPVTQAPENGQNYNRYSYVDNNPLRYTDPSGYRKTICVEKCGGTALEEVVVYGSPGPGPGGGNFSPGDVQRGNVGGSNRGVAGDRVGSGGDVVKQTNPVDEEELKPGECNESECKAFVLPTQSASTLNPASFYQLAALLAAADGPIVIGDLLAVAVIIGGTIYLATNSNDDSSSDKKAGRKKQGREKSQKKRQKNWTDNSNARNEKKPKKHTPGKGHRRKSKRK